MINNYTAWDNMTYTQREGWYNLCSTLRSAGVQVSYDPAIDYSDFYDLPPDIVYERVHDYDALHGYLQ